MRYDKAFFDQVPNRLDSIKWTTYGKDVIPLWIADMDFCVCPEIKAAIIQRAQTDCFGYARVHQGTIEALIQWHYEQYHWKIEPEWIVPQPGVVSSLHLFCQYVRQRIPTRTDMIVGEPVYHHFISAVKQQGLKEHKLTLADQPPYLPQTFGETEACGGWLFCNPENPLGYAWSQKELETVLAYSRANDLLVASDEIHGGLVLDPAANYTPILSLSGSMDNVISFVAPSKTFNIPGLGCAFAIVPNEAHRAAFRIEAHEEMPRITTFGWVGAEAAYRYGEPWRQGVLAYLWDNYQLLQRWCASVGLPLCPLSATYLAFIDCRRLVLENETPKAFFLKAGVACHDGAIFGRPGFIRLNIATQQATLKRALERMGNAIASLK